MDSTMNGELPLCLACASEGNYNPMTFHDMERLMGFDKVVDMAGRLERKEDSVKYPQKRVHCTKPGCKGSPQLYDPLYDLHQMFVCR